MSDEHLQEELSKLREQSRQALEASWSRAEKLRQELDETNHELETLEQQVNVMRMMRSSYIRGSMHSVLSAGNDESSSKRSSMASQLQPRGSMGMLSSRSSIGDRMAPRTSVGGRFVSSDESEDVRITLMRKEREEKISELNAHIEMKEEEIAKLQEKTMKQQEEIQRRNASLEELEAPHLCKSLQEQLKEQASQEKKLKKELSEINKTLSERQLEHITLEDEWHDCEDRLADAEAHSVNYLEDLQRKLRRYNEESSKAATNRTQMIQAAQESLESLRQDLMEHMSAEACNKLVREVKTGFEGLRTKEDELSRLLTGRIKERKDLSPSLGKLNKVHDDCRDLLKSVLILTAKIEQRAILMGTKDSESNSNAAKLVNSLDTQVGSVLSQLSKTLKHIVDSKDEKSDVQPQTDCTTLTQTSDRLTYTIQAKTRQMLRSLPDLSPDAATKVNGGGVAPEVLARFQARFLQKEQTLKAIQHDVDSIEAKTQQDSEKANKKADMLEEEIQFLLNGLDEKDRMIAAVSGVIDERRDAEASLLEDIEYLKKKGVIVEE